MKIATGLLTTVVAVFFALSLASCSTIPFAQQPGNITRVIGLYNAGDVAQLDQISQVPFLFNGEIVEIHADVNTMWTNLVKSGLKIKSPKIVATGAIGPRSYLGFADTYGVKVFFEKYLPKGSSLTRVAFDGGQFELLLGGRRGSFPVVVGIKLGAT